MVIKKQICDPWKKFLAAFRALQGGCPCRYVRWKDPQAGWEQISFPDCGGGTHQHPRGQLFPAGGESKVQTTCPGSKDTPCKT